MNKESFRDRQIGEQIKKILSSIIFNDVKDPRVKTVTLTSVKVTKDLSIARVYYRYFDDLNKNDVQTGLEKSSNFIFNRLRKAMRLKKIPQLTFYFDETPDNADRIEELLKDLNKDS
jgi:ribosome-binding factor A